MADEQKPAQPSTALMAVEKPTPMREMLSVLKDTGDPELFKFFARDIIEREVATARYGEDSRLARVFAASGAFDGISGTEVGVALAMTKIQLGRSWNMQPADAMEAINFINGRPSVATRYLGAKMQDAGISWDIEWSEDDKGACVGCSLHLKRWSPGSNQFEPIMGRVNGIDKQAVVSFTKKDAETAIIHEKGKEIRLIDKWNFKSWASDMYFARCVSRVRVRYAPNILSGILTREEAEDSGDTTGSPNGTGSARLAAASSAKIEDIGKRLVEAKGKGVVVFGSIDTPVQDVKAEEAKTAEATTSEPAKTDTDKAPWKERTEMYKFMSEMSSPATGIGKADYDRLMSEHKLDYSKMKFDAPETLACYRAMQARLAEIKKAPATDAPAGKNTGFAF